MLVQRPFADTQERSEAEVLLARCDIAEGLELPVVLPAPGELAEGGAAPILWLEEGQLVGLLVLEGWPIPEGTPLVHPAYRRRGIGRKLVEAATTTCRLRTGKRWLMAADAEGAVAPLFAASVSARYETSEYRMELEPAELPPRPADPQGLKLDEVSSDRLELFAATLAAAFDDPLDQVRLWTAEQHGLPNIRLFVASLGESPVATLRLITVGFHAYVTALGVLPTYRQRGIGRWLVLNAIHDLIDQGWEEIRIEVDTANEPAFQLYRACGFRERRTYRLYELIANS